MTEYDSIPSAIGTWNQAFALWINVHLLFHSYSMSRISWYSQFFVSRKKGTQMFKKFSNPRTELACSHNGYQVICLSPRSRTRIARKGSFFQFPFMLHVNCVVSSEARDKYLNMQQEISVQCLQWLKHRMGLKAATFRVYTLSKVDAICKRENSWNLLARITGISCKDKGVRPNSETSARAVW